MALLKLDDIHTYYGLSHILFGVSFEVERGEVLFVLGRNGVGKSTTLKSVMGSPNPRGGIIMYDGYRIEGLTSYKIARLGISLVPEDRRILSGLTVEENLSVARISKGAHGYWTMEKLYALFPILEKRKRQDAITLSGGEQQMLTIGRGLRSDPKLLLIDQPVEGLAPLVAKDVCRTLVEVKQMGTTTMLCVDDDTKLCGLVADRVCFMDQGKITWQGTVQEVAENDYAVAKRLLGVR